MQTLAMTTDAAGARTGRILQRRREVNGIFLIGHLPEGAD
jgi:hypothetical protein